MSITNKAALEILKVLDERMGGTTFDGLTRARLKGFYEGAIFIVTVFAERVKTGKGPESFPELTKLEPRLQSGFALWSLEKELGYAPEQTEHRAVIDKMRERITELERALAEERRKV